MKQSARGRASVMAFGGKDATGSTMLKTNDADEDAIFRMQCIVAPQQMARAAQNQRRGLEPDPDAVWHDIRAAGHDVPMNGTSFGPSHIEAAHGFGGGSQQQQPQAIMTTLPESSGLWDIEFQNEFGDVVSGHNVTKRDHVWKTSVNLEPKAPGLFFRSPLTKRTSVDHYGTRISFIEDAELALFMRSPMELHSTLTQSPSAWRSEVSTPRAYPTGEAIPVLNPTPLTLPATVVLPYTHTSSPFGRQTTRPFVSYRPIPDAFWYEYRGDPDYPCEFPWPHCLTRTANPTGRDARFSHPKILALRFLQHGPCDIETPLQEALNAAKTALVELLEPCGKGVISDLRLNDINVTPFITERAGDTASGILVHGNIMLFKDSVASRWGFQARPSCHIDFLYEYAIDIERGVNAGGIIVLRPSELYYHVLTDGGACDDIETLLKKPTNQASTAGVLTRTIPEFASGSQFQSVASFMSPKAAQCYQLDPTDTNDLVRLHFDPESFSRSCKTAADELAGMARSGAARFLGIDPKLQDKRLDAVVEAITRGADAPIAYWAPGSENSADKPTPSEAAAASHSSWACAPPSVFENDPLHIDTVVAPTCKFILRLNSATLQPDAILTRPFDSFDDFSNPSLALFFLLFGLGDEISPIKTDPNVEPNNPAHAFEVLCNRYRATSDLPPLHSGSSEALQWWYRYRVPRQRMTPSGERLNFYNRWYASMNIHDLSCANHSPYVLFSDVPKTEGPCKSDADCHIFESCWLGSCIHNAFCDRYDPFRPAWLKNACHANQFCDRGLGICDRI